MSNFKIVFPDVSSIGSDLDYSIFTRHGEVIKYDKSTPSELSARIARADIVAVNKCKLTREILACAPSLRLILEAATGYDNIDIDYCRERGIAVANVAGYSTDCVAQLTFSMALMLITHMKEYTSFVTDGKYSVSGAANRLMPQFHELCGKTWGIVGYGNIGKRVASIARAFGCRVIVNKRTPTADVECVDIDTLCRESDLISLHTPLTDLTRSLIGKTQLDEMKNTVILINVARGAVTDETAVANALTDGKIGAFGCDVYSAEPFPETHPFAKIKDYPNVCFTPHIAWGGYETRVRLLSEMKNNLDAFLNNQSRNRII